MLLAWRSHTLLTGSFKPRSKSPAQYSSSRQPQLSFLNWQSTLHLHWITWQTTWLSPTYLLTYLLTVGLSTHACVCSVASAHGSISDRHWLALSVSWTDPTPLWRTWTRPWRLLHGKIISDHVDFCNDFYWFTIDFLQTKIYEQHRHSKLCLDAKFQLWALDWIRS